MSYKSILSSYDHGYHQKSKKTAKHIALSKHKPMLTGRSQKEQMRFTKQNRDYQKKIGRAWND